MADPDREQPDDPLWLKVAFKELRDNVMEKPGAGDNPRIVKYLKTTNIGRELAKNDETAWCAAFINFCIEEAGLTGTKNASARSWLNFGKPIEKPVRGCIVVFERPPNPQQGHVGFYLAGSPPQIKILSGNTGPQSNAVMIGNHPKPVLGFRLPEGGLSMADVDDILKKLDNMSRLIRVGDQVGGGDPHDFSSLEGVAKKVDAAQADIRWLKAAMKKIAATSGTTLPPD
jgi:uncharacterized protein (TIGR02594 family)